MAEQGDWNFADVWEVIADLPPDAPALVHGDRFLTWRVVAIDTIGRAANGKVDHKRLREYAVDRVTADAS